MGKNSKIEWTHHTFNPWWGCVKISHACTHCYADAWARRVGQNLWGPKAPRRFFTDAHWNEPRKWDREAKAARVRLRVFCASMADVFEDRRDLDPHRERLWALIEETPNLDWLLLTKRPENIGALAEWKKWPRNVWLGTTVENQETAEERIPELIKHDVKVRFISAEPLLGGLDLSTWLGSELHWVIGGGESGGKARPACPSWFASLRDQCREHGAGFHFKQWGEWAPASSLPSNKVQSRIVADGAIMVRLGKKAAGRHLDGRTWDELPKKGKKTKRSRSSSISRLPERQSKSLPASTPRSGQKTKRA